MKIPAVAQVALAGALGYGGFVAFASPDAVSTVQSVTPFPVKAECVIKGNISINSGEKIYHVPGQDYYAQATIRPEYGERWFCSEEDAIKAGWRRART